MANIITGVRILCSAALVFCPAFSPVFYVLYCLAGFTDMIDGAAARQTHTAGEFGARLDTAADTVFAAVCLMKILPLLEIPVWLWLWTGGIAAIKLINGVYGYIAQGKFAAEHTVLNKIAGAVLFALPLLLPVVDVTYSGAAACAVATAAAVQEGRRVRQRGNPPA